MSHTGRNAGIASAAIVVVIIVGGFVVSVPVTTLVPVQVLLPHTVTVTYTTSSQTVVPVTGQGTGTSSVFYIGQTTLQPNYYTDAYASLTTGSDVGISYSADDTVDVYVFSSSEYSQYVSSGTTSPNIAEQTGVTSGTVGFHVNFADTYYLVLHNPHTGFLGIGGHNIGVSASGTDTYPTTTTTYITQTVTYTTSSLSVSTETSTSTSTQSCSYLFWNWLLGSKSCS